jgi:SCP-2 sterol transfer family protein
MSDPVDDFFNDLAQRGYEPLLQHASGSIRFDVLDKDQLDHWWIGIDRGRLTVSHENREAKSIIREDRSTLAEVILGRRNAMSTYLRGEAGYAGDTEPLVVFQRLFGQPARQEAWS